MNQDNSKNVFGFTLVELMLAMGFVSALLLVIALTVIQIGNIYNRGLTYKNVNQVGSNISSELQRNINNSPRFDLGIRLRYNSYGGQVFGGRLCTGQYSYVWNYGAAFSSVPSTTINRYSSGSNGSINFVKVYDPNFSHCTNISSQIDPAKALELLPSGQYNLAIHNISITSQPTAIDNSTGQQLYSISILLGTNNRSALSGLLGSTNCLTPNQSGADPTYCSVSQFNIVARAGNIVEL